ncbi:hypothetical protein BN1110_03164 [bacterium YEK0313]|nr:hypothetical protein BN1110_03164 [bacterium YEK0313]
MTRAAATGPSINDASFLLARSAAGDGASTPSDLPGQARTTPGSPALSRTLADRVDLSDRAKALLARQKVEQATADTLERLMRAIKDSTGRGRPPAAGPSQAPSFEPAKASAAAGDQTLDFIRSMAGSSEFGAAADGRTDDQVRALVRDGRLPAMPALDDGQRAQLSERETNVYEIVRGLQGLYEAMPKSLDDALARRVQVILDSYPESIARMKQGVADGSLKEETWPGIIAGYEEQLAAAREGRMTIAAETDPRLVQGRSDFTMRRDAIGFSGNGQRTTTSDWTALHAKYGANVEIGSSPYTPGWVITW